MSDDEPTLEDKIREAHRRAAAAEAGELVRGLADLLRLPEIDENERDADDT